MPPVKMKGLARPKNFKKVISRLLSYMGKYKILWLVVLLCIILSSLADVAGSYLIKPALNNYIIPLIKQENPDFSDFLQILGLLAIFFAFGALGSYLSSRLQLHIMSNLLFKIRTDLFSKIQKLPIKFFDSNTHGDLMSRFTNDTDTLREMFTQAFPQLMNSVITVTGIFIVMIVLNPILTLTVIVILFFMMILATRLGKKSAESFRQQQKNIGKVNGYIEELIEGQKVVKVFNYEQEAKTRFAELNNDLCESGTKANTYANIIGPCMGNLSHVQYAIIAIFGAFLVIAGKTDLGTIAAFLQYTRSFSRPITMVSQLFNSILNALAGAERIFNIIDEIPEVDNGRINLVYAYNAIVDKDKNRRLVQSFSYTGDWAWKDNADNSLYALKGEVVFNNVSFGYRKEKTVLHEINIHAKPSQKIALVGSTGSGKTTIINLLSRFYDLENGNGEILYDGFELNKIKKDDLRRSLGIVLQDTHLFTGTIYENIKYGNLEASKKQVIEAAKLANAHFFIEHLPNGYDTVITGDGASLSQGQRQLLAIARVAVCNPPLLILDEATSSIDTRTEKLIQNGMDKLMTGRTVFVIAHRLSTVRNADEILVLEKGRIIERGNHDQLMEQQGKYYQLYTGNSSKS